MPLHDFQDEIIDQNRIARFMRNQRREPFRRAWRGFKALIPWFILLGVIIPLIGHAISARDWHPIIATYIDSARAMQITLWNGAGAALSYAWELVEWVAGKL